MLMDFKEIKRRAKVVLDELDHFYLNDITPFNDELNPTAENIACFLFDRLSKDINDNRISVASVKVWENDRNCATFSRD
jgi:6-pyruvoyltetrahydropterin/6-carboxytetrahydropterin synthase